MRVAFLLPLLFTAAACEPEIGGICDPNTEFVNQLVGLDDDGDGVVDEDVGGTDNLVQDVRLDNCSQGFCASTDGSRPYCTVRCECEDLEDDPAGDCVNNVECAAAGPGFVCQEIVTFGPLACVDFEDPLAPRPGTEPSGAECASSADCTAPERCFPSGAFANTCGEPGRDCLTGENVGEQSLVPLKYCAASSADIIIERDRQYGRIQ